MRILFCNIAWLSYYDDLHANEIPMNGGKYVKENKFAHESWNFQYENGKCYGFVNLQGTLQIHKYFNGVRSTDNYVNDVLVVWVATNENYETRIVGWYKNATVYKNTIKKPIFTVNDSEYFYNIVAEAKDCFLVSEGNRNFKINRATKVGEGKGFGRSNVWYADSEYAKKYIVPDVIDYIENYDGYGLNIGKVEKDIEIEMKLEIDSESENFDKVIRRKFRYYSLNNYRVDSIRYMRAVRKVKESKEILSYLAQAYYEAHFYKKALEILVDISCKYGLDLNDMALIIKIYDFIEDYKNLIKYCNMVIDVFDKGSKESIEYLEDCFYIMLNYYIYSGAEDKAFEIIKRLECFGRKYNLDININKIKGEIIKNFGKREKL